MRLAVMACGVSLLALSLPGEAEAQYSGYGYGQAPVRNVQCERQKSSDGTTGAVVGAVVGGLLGGAIGNNIDNDRYHTRYGRRGPVTYKESRSNSGQVAVGATLGALVGGLAGSDIGKKSGGDCHVAYAPSYGYSSVSPGSIPQSTQGLYGGAEVMRGAPGGYPRSAPQQYPASGYPAYPAQGQAPAYPQPAPAPDYQYQYGGGPATPSADCRVIHRETRMPDGQVLRDPVTACWHESSREWRVQDGWENEELYGY